MTDANLMDIKFQPNDLTKNYITKNYIALHFSNNEIPLFTGDMPCGHKFSYKAQDIPRVNTKCPDGFKCDMEECWIIKYGDQ